MAIDKTQDWVPASKSMDELVHEGRRLTWRKSYNDTKNKKVVEYFNYSVVIYEGRIAEDYIYETRKYEYTEVRMLGKYHLPRDLEDLCADLFDLSLAYKLVVVDTEYLEIVVEESKDGSTNIDETVMEAMMDSQKKVARQLQRKKRVR